MPNLAVIKQYSDPIPPTEGQLDAAFQSIETFFNITGVGGENIQDGVLDSSKFAAAAATESKLKSLIAATAKFQDGSVTAAKLAEEIRNALTPAATIQAWSGDTAPTGWLVCDGIPVSRTTYSRLFAVVGVRYGAGDGTTTFNPPDFRGRFLRGTDLTSGRDTDVALRTAMNPGGATGGSAGSIQGDDLAYDYLEVDTVSVINPGGAQGYSSLTNATTGLTGALSINANQNADTRPKNASVVFIIKT